MMAWLDFDHPVPLWPGQPKAAPEDAGLREGDRVIFTDRPASTRGPWTIEMIKDSPVWGTGPSSCTLRRGSLTKSGVPLTVLAKYEEPS